MVQKKFDGAKVHTKGRGERETTRGEWFHPVPALMELIGRLPPYEADCALADDLGDILLAHIAILPPYEAISEEERYRQLRLASADLTKPVFGKKSTLD